MASGDKLYEQLNTLKLSDVSATNISNVTDPLHLQKTNEDALRTTVLVNTATMRNDGGPIPATSTVQQVDWDDGGGSLTYIMTAAAGEVWRIMTGAYTSTGGTSTITLYVKDEVLNRYVTLAIETVNDGVVTLDPFKDVYIDENSSVRATVSVSDSTSEVLQLLVNRVR